MLIIGIAGGTGSGKTTVVKKIIDALPKNEVTVLPPDFYYNDNAHIPLEERHELYIEPSKRYADLIIPQGGNNNEAIMLLTDYIRSLLSSGVNHTKICK